MNANREILVEGFFAEGGFFRLPTVYQSFFEVMTLDALKHGNVAEIYRMLERLIRLMASVALAIGERAEINRMLERTTSRVLFGRSG